MWGQLPPAVSRAKIDMPSPAKSLLDPEVVQCPYPYYEELRRERPIAFLPELNGYFASSYEMVRQILRDKRFLKGAAENDGRKFVVPHKPAQEILLADAEIGLPSTRKCFSSRCHPRGRTSSVAIFSLSL